MFSLSVPESWTRVSLKRRHPQSAKAAGAEELGQIWHTSQPMLTLTHIIVPQSREEKSHLWMHHSVSPFWQKKKKCLICYQQLDWRLLSQKKLMFCLPVRCDTEKMLLRQLSEASEWISRQRRNQIFICWPRNKSVRAFKQGSYKMSTVNCMNYKLFLYQTFVGY